MTKYPDDKLIINKLKEGDILSFDYIFKKYNKKVYLFALSYLKNKEEAEDVVQEVFLNLWKYKGQINEYYDFSKYLFKITHNTICKKFRKQASDKRQLEEVLRGISFEDNGTDFEIEYNNLLETINLLIDKLPSRQKQIFLLSTIEQLTNEQIGEQLSISKKTVDNHLTIAKSTLRKSIFSVILPNILFFSC